MKPPICEVCDDRFAPADGELVSFLATPESKAFDERAEMPGFVGHAPNTGWFCPAHVDDARDRAGSMTLAEALEEMTGHGVDLHGGQIRRRTGDDSRIEWDLQPIALSTVRERFVELVATLFEELELGPVPELSVTTTRSWTPMDGAVEPNCPYVDYVRHEPTTGEIPPMVSISSDAAYWNDGDISNVGANLFIRVGGHRIAAFANGRGDHDACTSLSLFRPTTEAIVTALTGAFSDRLR